MSENLVGEKLGNFRLERLLGRGRMGVVYLARDEALLRPTAVKILSWSIPESGGQNPEAWFIAEARNVARINHPNVVQIYGVARHGTHCYIAMEYVDGPTIDVWIAQNGPFTVELATELLIQTAGALQAAHDANVVHRDVKPENLMLGSDGKAKLGDFGMAMYTARPRAAEATRAGTPYYTAPELWRGCAASASSDVYALGATYYYLLTGHPPFLASELQELVAAHLHSPIPDMKSPKGNIPNGCQDIVRRCMEKTPQQRLPSAQAVGWEARAFLRRLVSIAPPTLFTQGLGAPVQGSQVSLPNVISLTSPALNVPLSPTVHWHSFYGFAREPFTPYEIGCAPYQGEPFLSILAQLKERLNGTRGATVLLIGANGAGRTSLAQELLIQQICNGPCVHVSCRGIGSTQTLAKRILWALGMPTGNYGGSNNDVDALVEHCLAIRDTVSIPLLVIDDCETSTGALDEIVALAQAARHTNSYRLLLLGTKEFEQRLIQRGTTLDTASWEIVPMRPLNGVEVSRYVASWLSSTLAPGVAPIVFTPDAIFIVTYRSEGVLARINQLASNMLLAAALRGRRVLDSWDAWTAPLEPSDGSTVERPTSWPTAEALEVINRYRRQVEMQIRR